MESKTPKGSLIDDERFKWIDSNYFVKILEDLYGTPIEINSIQAPASSIIEKHMDSLTIRININFTKNTTDIISKDLIFKTSIAETMTDKNVRFGREIDLHMKILPSIYEQLEIIESNCSYYPKLIYASKDPHLVIIVEDCKTTAFSIPLRCIETVELIVTQLARWHAASYSVYENTMDEIGNGLFTKGSNYNKIDFARGINTVAEILEEWPYCEHFEPYVRRFSKIFDDKLMDIFGTNSNGYNVLGHGDFQWQHFGYKLSMNAEIKTIFNNFESYCWVSPAIDLIHLLYLWIDDSLRLEYREEILYRYHLEFKESLTKLNCVKKIPSLLDLQLELLKAGPYVMFLMFVAVPRIYAEQLSLDVDVCSQQNQDTIMGLKILLNYPEYVRRLQCMLPKAVYKGFLDLQ